MRGVRIDDAFLRELGLQGLTAAQKREFRKRFLDVLELAVGHSLFHRMNERELDAFESLVQNHGAGSNEAKEWLNRRFSEYPEVVEQQLDQLIARVRTAIREVASGGTRVGD